ncbi:MotA/TolQ/ExbB proton channel family protein [Qingshengfaniella alkalisoli]|uniref:MotA/TolQ/ExbB proton channel family protein n=1 Tax=Qingshengfaniella alkalisoli TaxID=2599296 RepID=A0A5B8JAP2_9RHOB|nr:MotA/TolQ/ExbB proton channel family protein [Qingshengfaniella alkalisoli]QDY71240.1 MotA/TolQ/ExbB proton channel family protein [Qingshengfaniella alkalisoli]
MLNLSDLMRGGPIIAVLAVLSVVSVALIVVKAIELRGVTSGTGRRSAAVDHWRKGETREAVNLTQSGTAPADRVLLAAMEGMSRDTSPALLETDLVRRGNEELERMNRHIRLLELIAMISPLLGLLGTVLGMIQSFQQLELAQGSANAAVLAGGIWQALLTTAAGLLVAIPAAIGASLLSSRAESAGHLIESSVGALMLAEDARHRRD